MKWMMKRQNDALAQQEGPPNIDEILKKWMGRGGSSGGGGSNRPASSGPSFFSPKIILIGFLGLLVLWVMSGFYIVHPAEEAVVLRFGELVRTETEGLHWVPQGIEKRYTINVDQVMMLKLEQVMLTKSENMVSVAFAVQYRIKDIEAYLFNVMDPVHSLKQIMDSSVRQVVGRSELDDILTKGRTLIAEDVRKQIVELVDRYNTGLEITDVAMQSARAPDPVKDAFDDVIKAREDKVRVENEAKSYANHLVPVAHGRANRLMQAAKADASELVFEAKGQVSQFEKLLPEYIRAPTVMMDRLYFDTMEKVLSESRVVIVDEGQGNSNLLYLPLDQLIKPLAPAVSASPAGMTQSAVQKEEAAKAANMDIEESTRDRRRREFLEN